MFYDQIDRDARPFSEWEVVERFLVVVGQLPPDYYEKGLLDRGVTVCEHGAVIEGIWREWFALRRK